MTSTVSSPRRDERGQRLADERRLAVAPGGDEEDLLPGGQVGDQAVELDLAVGERSGRDDLAVDEGVGHGVTLMTVAITETNVTQDHRSDLTEHRVDTTWRETRKTAAQRSSGSCPV